MLCRTRRASKRECRVVASGLQGRDACCFECNLCARTRQADWAAVRVFNLRVEACQTDMIG